MKNLKATLFELFGEAELKEWDSWENHYTYHTDDFHVEIEDDNGLYLVMVDLHGCFNKSSQCPLCFRLDEYKPLSRRKKNRIHQAINFLLMNKKDAGTFWSHLPGFDDLGQDVRYAYYNKN